MRHNKWVGLGIVVCFVVGSAWGMRPRGTAPATPLSSEVRHDPAPREPITVALENTDVTRAPSSTKTTSADEARSSTPQMAIPNPGTIPIFSPFSPPSPTYMPDVPTMPSSVGFGGPGIGTGGRGAFNAAGPQ